MSTRACYTFKDDHDEFHVYKHCDGYPSGAAEFITNALHLAWKLPRFEADEFGASFVAANKNDGGGVRLTHDWQNHGDLEYRYLIYMRDDELYVDAFDMGEKPIFSGNLAAFTEFSKTYN